MSDLIVAFGLVLVIEGLIYAVAPGTVKRMLQSLDTLAPQALRVGGLVAATIGVLIVWTVRG
ncbi:MAG: DUF2065 domain-containing protein [Pseudomonadota bacterium]